MTNQTKPSSWEGELKNIFGEDHHKICEGLDCECKNVLLAFIKKVEKEAYERGYEEGCYDGAQDQYQKDQLT